MSYPQTAQATSSAGTTPVAQEPISNVLGQALQQCEDVERRIKELRDRLQIGPADRLGKDPGVTPPSGIIAKSNGLRNVSARLQELCSELETLL